MIGQELIIPEEYKSQLSIKETEKAIKLIKDYFENRLASYLNLTRVSAPLFVRPQTGLNDDLTGVERPVSFDVKGMGGEVIEIVHSLAKWKRLALHRYGFKHGEGLYTDMNAIRRDEVLDNTHSIYVDQWDWEKIISKEERTEQNLKQIVNSIYKVFKDCESLLTQRYSHLEKLLPDEIYFITAQELEDRYPGLTAKEREDAIAKEKKAVFIMQIGGLLKSGTKHDDRAPDYDDWELNGDILFWYPVLNCAMEISSMGIRVDEKSLERQLKITGSENKNNLLFHRKVLEGKLPYTIGGGIGQSRICMFLLQKAHIGEVQASVWPDDMVKACFESGINLL
ncbi:MAG: aspartate--ammonia ligase [Clostridiales bacterium]|jgi:aspartate--ammonia ligase|nr:aspartate--ammonia ligase [Bacillota bacterium]NLH59600.1 aspartate--ammonia ligase [Clostridiales bacterium]